MISSNSHQRLSFVLTALCLFLPTTSVWPQESRPQPRLILDADSANEIDDMYAITRTLKQDRFNVLALTSAQWIHYLAEPDSVAASQCENEALVKLLGRENLPTPQGSAEPMGKPWGGDEAKDSPAAQFIVQSAKKASPDNKLVVVCLGASTNLASAIKLAPEIAPNIDAYILGFRYDVDANVWNKSSFNIRRDLNACGAELLRFNHRSLVDRFEQRIVIERQLDHGQFIGGGMADLFAKCASQQRSLNAWSIVHGCAPAFDAWVWKRQPLRDCRYTNHVPRGKHFLTGPQIWVEKKFFHPLFQAPRCDQTRHDY